MTTIWCEHECIWNGKEDNICQLPEITMQLCFCCGYSDYTFPCSEYEEEDKEEDNRFPQIIIKGGVK